MSDDETPKPPEESSGQGQGPGDRQPTEGGSGSGTAPDRPARADRPEQPQRPAQPGRNERPQRPAQPDRPERPQRPGRPGPPARPTRPERPAQPDRSGQLARPERPDQPEPSEQAARPEQPAKSQQPAQTGQPARPGHGKEHGHRFAGLRRELPAERPAPRIRQPLPEPPVPDRSMTGRQRLLASVWPPRVTRPQLTVALLLCVLGLGLAIQVRSTNENSVLRGARQEDLVRILDELDDRTQRLEDEKQRLVGQRTELENSSDQAEEARKQTKAKEQQLGVLAGTVAAQGPGITLRITDTHGAVEADMLLDAIQELRAAGAEAIQINDVRVVADTYFTDADSAVEIDGRRVSQPYTFTVIGKPEDLEPALNIPGGVVQTLEKERANVSVKRHEKIVVDALRSAKRPDYARSSS